MFRPTDRSIEEELDAAMAALGPLPNFSRAVLEGVTVLRPALAGDLQMLTGIAADRLVAANLGQLELDPDEIDRIEGVTNYCAMELATATPQWVDDGDELVVHQP